MYLLVNVIYVKELRDGEPIGKFSFAFLQLLVIFGFCSFPSEMGLPMLEEICVWRPIPFCITWHVCWERNLRVFEVTLISVFVPTRSFLFTLFWGSKF